MLKFNCFNCVIVCLDNYLGIYLGISCCRTLMWAEHRPCPTRRSASLYLHSTRTTASRICIRTEQRIFFFPIPGSVELVLVYGKTAVRSSVVVRLICLSTQ